MQQVLSFVLLHILLGNALASDGLSFPFCNQTGLCLGLSEGVTLINTEWDCARRCASSDNCDWYSYDPSDTFCATLSTCPSLDSISCPACVSGQKECDVKACFVRGECSEGEIAGKTKSDSIDDCLKACKDNTLCKWFTFYTDFRTCFFYGNCQGINESCENCITAQEECSISQGTFRTKQSNYSICSDSVATVIHKK